MTTQARTPSISGVHAAQSMLVRGLHVVSPIVRGAKGGDIATTTTLTEEAA